MSGAKEMVELAERIEAAADRGEMDAICRELHGIDEAPNVNGSCAAYLYDIYEARRLIPPNHVYSICHDVNEVRAVVGLFLTERDGGFSVVPHGLFADTRALVAAALRARNDNGAASRVGVATTETGEKQ